MPTPGGVRTGASPHLLFWLLTLAVLAVLLLWRLLPEGSFFDGTLYAVISRNLAAGRGTFWQPCATQTLFPSFHEHPPLGLWIESLAFRVFGDGLLVERLTSLATAVATGALIVAAWRLATSDLAVRDAQEGEEARGQRGADLRGLAWFPLLLWLAMPRVQWSYAYNLLENTMGVFTSLAIYVLLRASLVPRAVPAHLLAAGLCVAAAVLVKGPAGGFPFATLACAWVFLRRTSFRVATRRTLLVVACCATAFGALALQPEARQAMASYAQVQLAPSLSGQRGHSGPPFHFLWALLAELAPAIGVSGLLLLLGARRRSLVGSRAVRSWALTFAALGLCGSLPIAVSPVRLTRYAVAAFPWLALALALLAAPVLADLLRRIDVTHRLFRVGRALAWVLLAAVLVRAVTLVGTIGRDAQAIADVKRVGTYLAARAQHLPWEERVLPACPGLRDSWQLHAYMARYFDIGIDAGLLPGSDAPDPIGAPARAATGGLGAFLLAGGDCAGVDLEAYARVPLDLDVYTLHERR
jgi:4-amino-4-deoxy-L-arabinose transferase-like glycosyltransferase